MNKPLPLYQENVTAGATWEMFVTKHNRRGKAVIHICLNKNECYLIDCLFPQRKNFHTILLSGGKSDTQIASWRKLVIVKNIQAASL